MTPISKSIIYRKARLILLLLVLPIAMYLHNYYIEHVPLKILRLLEIEFSNIEPFPGINLMDYKTYYKANVVLVEAKYSANIDSSLIFEYYKAKLLKNGWAYCCVIQTDSVEVLYQKGKYTAYITCSDNDAKTVIVSFSWGLGGCRLDCKKEE